MEKKYYRVNEQIKTDKIRLIDVDGAQLGIKLLQEALILARNKNLDLVEVSNQSDPPVCRILEFSKFRYEQEKKSKEQRKKRSGVLKEIKVRQKISEHDMEVKIKKMEDFIKDRDKIKFSVVFFGREMAHIDLGWNLMNKVIEKMSQVAKIDESPRLMGNSIIVIFSPKK